MPSNDKPPTSIVLRINPDDPQKNVRGRSSYLQALSQYINPFCESLRDEVLYRCDYFECMASERSLPEGSQEMAQASFDRWLGNWGIVDEWLKDGCWHTIQRWALEVHENGRETLNNRHPLPVWYGANDANLAAALSEFQPIFEQPYPAPLSPLSPGEMESLAAQPLAIRIFETTVARESASKFRKRMQVQFGTQLAAYIAQCEARILEVRNAQRDAAWTALFQCGLTPKRIEAWEFKRSGNAFSHARIQQAVKKFAASIGLTLRKPKAGRNSKRIGIQPHTGLKKTR